MPWPASRRHGRAGFGYLAIGAYKALQTLLADGEVRAIGVSNFVPDFELSDQELAAIDALDTGVRGGPEPASVTLENYGQQIPEA